MALRLLWERSRGRESPFCPFVQAMPPVVDTLRACPAHLLPELQDEALQTRVAEWQRACATEWARVSALLRWRTSPRRRVRFWVGKRTVTLLHRSSCWTSRRLLRTLLASALLRTL